MSVERLINTLAERGLRIGLDGPEDTINPEYRWTLRVCTKAHDSYGRPLDRKMFHGDTPGDVLTQAIDWKPRIETAS